MFARMLSSQTSTESACIHSSGQKRTARNWLSSFLACVVLPDPGKPHTIISVARDSIFSFYCGKLSAGHAWTHGSLRLENMLPSELFPCCWAFPSVFSVLSSQALFGVGLSEIGRASCRERV